MAQLLTSLGAAFDYILIDAPPLLPVSDASVLGTAAAGVLLVVAAGHVKRAELELALRSLDDGGSRTVGLVLAMLPSRGPDSFGYGTNDTYYARIDEAAPTSVRSRRR